MLQKDSNTSFFSFGSREMEQCPSVGIADLRRVPLLQHSPYSADIPCCHCSLDLQLLVKLRIPSAVMVQHPVTFRNGNFHLYLTSVRKNHWTHSLGWGTSCVWSLWLKYQGWPEQITTIFYYPKVMFHIQYTSLDIHAEQLKLDNVSCKSGRQMLKKIRPIYLFTS